MYCQNMRGVGEGGVSSVAHFIVMCRINQTGSAIFYSIMYSLLSKDLAVHFTAHLSRVMRKPTFCICENKDADQLRGNREADQRLCFRYIDSAIPLLPIHEISSL